MRTKEDFLAEEINKSYSSVSVEYIKSQMIKGNGVSESALRAMEEYSEEMACGFVEWKDNNSTYAGFDKVILYNHKCELKTTKELYQIYLEHLNK